MSLADSLIRRHRSRTSAGLLARVARTVAEALEPRTMLTTVTSIQFDIDSPQHVTTVTFSDPIDPASLAATDFVVYRADSDGRYGPTAFSYSLNAAHDIAKFWRTNGRYQQGDYTARIFSEDILDTSGDPLDTDASTSFFYMPSNVTGPNGLRDRVVDAHDWDLMDFNYELTPATFSQGDANYNGTVDDADYNVATYANTIPAPVPKETLLALGLSKTAANGIELSWVRTSNVSTGYVVQRSTDRGRNYSTLQTNLSPTAVSYVDSTADVTAGVKYTYRVRTIEPNDPNTHLPQTSLYVSGTYQQRSGRNYIAAPSGVSVTNTTKNAITLSWIDETDAETGFEVYRRVGTTGAFELRWRTGDVDVVEWKDTNLKADKRYYYFVRALGSTTSGSSNFADAMTLEGAPSVIAGGIELDRPQRLFAEFDQPVSTNGTPLSSSNVSVYSLTEARQFLASELTVHGITGSALDRIAISLNGFGVTNLLPDGNFEIIVGGSAVKNANNKTIEDGGYPEGIAETFFYQGDANHDRIVNFDDLVPLAQNYNKTGMTYAQGDITGDGTVNFDDLVLLSQRYNSSLPEPLKAASSLAASTGALLNPATDPQHTATPFNAAYVEWTAPASGTFTGYKVWRSVNDSDWGNPIATLPITDLHYIDRNLREGSRYSYRVRPYVGTSYGQATNRESVVTSLTAPANINAEPTGSNSIRVTWSDRSSAETSYEVLVLDATSPQNGLVRPVVTLPANSTFAEIDGLTPGMQYRIVVNAKTAAASAPMVATSLVMTRIAAPINATMTVNSPTSATVTWTDNSNQESGYTVRAIANATFTDATGNEIAAGTVLATQNVSDGAGSGTTQSTTITGLPENVDVFFDVTANAGPGGSSSTTSTTKPTGSGGTGGTSITPGHAVSSVKATPILLGNATEANADEFDKAADQIKIEWTDNQQNVAHYYVWMKTPKKALLTVIPGKSGSSGKFSFIATALDPMEDYSFAVQPEVTDAPEVSDAASNSATTGMQYAGVSPGLWATDVTGHSVTLHWNPVEDADAHFVLYKLKVGDTGEPIQIGEFGGSASKFEVSGLVASKPATDEHEAVPSQYIFGLKTIYHGDRYIETATTVTTDPDTAGEANERKVAMIQLDAYKNMTSEELYFISRYSNWKETYGGLSWYNGAGFTGGSGPSPGDHYLSWDAWTYITRIRMVTKYYDFIFPQTVHKYTGGPYPEAQPDPLGPTPELRYTFTTTPLEGGGGVNWKYTPIAPQVSSDDYEGRTSGEVSAVTPSGSMAGGGTSFDDEHPLTSGQTIRFTQKSKIYKWDGHYYNRLYAESERMATRWYTAPEYSLDSNDGLEAEDDAPNSDDEGDDDGNGGHHSPTPSGLMVIESTATTNKIHLRDNAKNEQGLEVERTRDGIHWSQVWTGGSVDGAARNIEFIDAGLTPGIEYEYRARAFKWVKTDQKLDKDQPEGPNNVLHALKYTSWSASTEDSKGLTDAEIGTWAETPEIEKGQTQPGKFGLYRVGEAGDPITTSLRVPSSSEATYFDDYTLSGGLELPSSPPATTPVDFSFEMTTWLQNVLVNAEPSNSIGEEKESLPLEVMPGDRDDPDYEPAGATALMKLADRGVADLDIDSDNNNGMELPDESDAEDDIEESDSLGKAIPVHSGDLDNDSIPDVIDFNGIVGESFVPVTFTIPTAFITAHPLSLVRFRYAASDPRAAHLADGKAILPSGHLRLWTKNAGTTRIATPIQSSGDWIPDYDEFNLERLLVNAPSGVLFAEGVVPNDSIGESPIELEIDIDGDAGPAGFIKVDRVVSTIYQVELKYVQSLISPGLTVNRWKESTGWGGVSISDGLTVPKKDYILVGAHTFGPSGASEMVEMQAGYDLIPNSAVLDRNLRFGMASTEVDPFAIATQNASIAKIEPGKINVRLMPGGQGTPDIDPDTLLFLKFGIGPLQPRTMQSATRLPVKAVFRTAYLTARVELMAIATAGHGSAYLPYFPYAAPVSAEMLNAFLYGTVPEAAVAATTTVQAGEYKYTHPTGANFGVASAATIPLYTFTASGGSAYPGLVQESFAIKEAVVAALRGQASSLAGKIGDGQVDAYLTEEFDLPISEIKMDESEDFDLQRAFGDLKASGITFVANIKYDASTRSYLLLKFRIAGGRLDDLYDFDYDAGTLSKIAATVQASGIGVGSGETVYKYVIDFNGGLSVWKEFGNTPVVLMELPQ